MQNLRITNGFDRLSDANLEVRANQIINDLTENFSTAPGLAGLTDARDNYTAALAVAVDGSKYEKALKNQRRTALIEELHLMANYILNVCEGDRVKAISSGFTIAKEPSPAPELTKPANTKLEDGPATGSLKFSFEKPQSAKSYIYQATQEPLTETSNWSTSVGTKRKFLFAGLESGKRYWVRVAALGMDDQMVYSDPISRIVQ